MRRGRRRMRCIAERPSAAPQTGQRTPRCDRSRGSVHLMASTQDLKRRLRSITNTRKLTRAMELVASARLRRAQQRIEAMRPYADRMGELMTGVAKAAGAVPLPLLQRRDVKSVAVVPITGDRGMAG